MIGLDDLPLWCAILISALAVIGATLTLIGAYGFLRLNDFYDRLHAPTLATSGGTALIVLASALLASFTHQRPIFHELVVGLCILMVAPVTLMLLGRASLHRDRVENSPRLPPEIREATPSRSAETP